MQLKSIPFVQHISIRQFRRQFIQPAQPVVIKGFIEDCPALHRWNYSYFKEKAGDRPVSVHGAENSDPDKVTSVPVAQTTFGSYLDDISDGPSEQRLFLFNLLLDKPELRKEIRPRILAKNFLSSLPLMFFGGAGSSVRLHYDIDRSHVFLTQFEGRKKVWLFAPDQSDLLYRLPFNFHGIVDLRHPDFEKFPALRYAEGYECILEPGDTLFIPSGYWHYIQYVTHGYSVSYRALSASFTDKVKGAWNLIVARKLDNMLRSVFGERWFVYKKNIAFKRAERAIDSLWSGDEDAVPADHTSGLPA
ncbi:cupin-like domain-containing protein [Terrimonas sp. NA20]|uniref:Cupin-like domain-containing protein n=1 Tax=Terrimonas ginsenosidimutans TaxID=2908004 RepID=A0ABS9KLR9_9BACT|nr:cupin-like domain-containing protein [Terrimonas ginsenosidimutans]MCG2613269.1 cupin-like domain-containing protein [Terrimonas ginsenosidimutans]